MHNVLLYVWLSGSFTDANIILCGAFFGMLIFGMIRYPCSKFVPACVCAAVSSMRCVMPLYLFSGVLVKAEADPAAELQ